MSNSPGNFDTYLRFPLKLLGLRFKSIPRGFKTLGIGRQVLFVPFAFVALGFVALLYIITRQVVVFTLAQGDAGTSILMNGLATVMSSLFFLLLVSTLITATTTLFRSRETIWLFGQPIKPITIYIYKAMETSLYSAWIMFVLAIPILAGLVIGVGAGTLSVLWMVLLALLLFAISCVLGLLLAFVLVWALPWIQRYALVLLTVVLGIGIYSFLQSRNSTSTNLLPDLNSFSAVEQYVNGLQTSSPLMPGSWFSLAFWNFVHGNLSQALYWAALMLTSLLMGIEVVLLVAKSWYMRLWWYAWGNGFATKKRKLAHMLHSPVFPRMVTLLEKDAKTFVRDTRQWLQSLSLLGLLSVFVLLLRQVPSHFKVMQAMFATMVAYLSFATVGYFFTTFALRYVFPAMSLEGRSFWSLLTLPMRRSKVLLLKLIPLLVAMLVVALLGTVFINSLLGLPQEIAKLSLIATLGVVLVIVFLTFGVGTIWINLKENDPAKLSSSLPAIVCTMVVFGYLTLMVVALAVPFDQYFKSIFGSGTFDQSLANAILTGIVGSALILSGTLWLLTAKLFEGKDF